MNKDPTKQWLWQRCSQKTSPDLFFLGPEHVDVTYFTLEIYYFNKFDTNFHSKKQKHELFTPICVNKCVLSVTCYWNLKVAGNQCKDMQMKRITNLILGRKLEAWK